MLALSNTTMAEEHKQPDMTAFTTHGTMLETMLTSKVGEERVTMEFTPETLGMLQLLQGKIITKEDMDRLLVSKEQVLVALVGQLVGAEMTEQVKGLLEGVTSEEGMSAVPWKEIMTQYTHEEVPASWMTHTLGCADKHNWTRLELAIVSKNKEAALRILEFGADACRLGQVNGNTALIMACRKGLGTVALKILDFGAHACRLGQVDGWNGNTALIMACSNGMETVALKILEFGADVCNVGHVNKIGETALFSACRHFRSNVALKILEFGADACRLGQVSEYGSTALILACLYALDTLALKILEFGADVCNLGCANKRGNTALMMACSEGLDAVALKILKCGAAACRLGQVTSNGDTALIMACKKGMKTVALKILEFGAYACELKHANNRGKTAQMLAEKGGEPMHAVVDACIKQVHMTNSPGGTTPRSGAFGGTCIVQ